MNVSLVDKETIMGSKHTPGPWSVHFDNYNEDYSIEAPVGNATDTILELWYLDEETHHRFHTFHNETPEQAKANAEFIVRACNSHDELVEALEKALLMLDADGTWLSGIAKYPPASLVARADAIDKIRAIAKAKETKQ